MLGEAEGVGQGDGLSEVVRLQGGCVGDIRR